MKHRYILFFYILLLIHLSFISCTKETINESPGGSGGTGTIYGIVNYAPSSSGSTVIPLKGVTITISGANATTTSDSTGIFTFKNVGIGSYTVTYHKDGYGDIKTFNFQFMGNGQGYLDPVTMTHTPDFKFFSLKDSMNINIPFFGDTNYTINGVFNISHPDSMDMNYIMTFATSKDATINSPNLLYTNSDNIAAQNQLEVFSLDMTNAIYTMRSLGMKTHNTYIFIKVYPVPSTSRGYGYGNYGDYTDPIKGVQFTSVGEPLSGQLYLP